MSIQLTLRVTSSSIRSRKEFHSANKDLNESIEDWYHRLRLLAETCDYDCHLDVFQLDQFIIGLDEKTLDHLCTEQSDLSLTKIIDISRNYEFAKEYVDIKPVLIEIKEEEPLSEAELYDEADSINDVDNYVEDFQPIIPFMAETLIESQPLYDIPKFFECYLCHKTWKSVCHLTYHFIRHHTIGKIPKCHLCGKWIKDASNMVRHLNVHLSLKPYHCDMCGFSFSRSTLLAKHILKHKESNAENVQCSKCQKTFISTRHLQIHRKMHNEPAISLGQKLDEVIEKRKSIKAKTKALGTGNSFNCELFSVTFEDERTYDEHMKGHCETEWLCHLCGKKLKNKRNLIHHYRVHTGEKPFKCDDCNKVFSCKEKLKLHSKGHNGNKSHVCLICNKSFIQKGHLASHSKSHFARNLEFKCDQCPQQFSKKERFDRHMRIHAGLRPFVCNFPNCEKSFNTNWHRSDHERTHTGEKPYQCFLCDKRFTQSGTLGSFEMARQAEDSKTL